jgi:hypothetical protein
MIVKVSPRLTQKNQLSSVIINNFKDYTSRYFKKSSSPFFIENEFYKDLTESLQIRLVKDYLTNPEINDKSMFLNQFLHTFEFLFNDSEYSFNADNKLITFFIASLKLEFCYSKENLLQTGTVSHSIFFMFEGVVEVTMIREKEPFMILDSGCYFGDISYLFSLRNNYKY